MEVVDSAGDGCSSLGDMCLSEGVAIAEEAHIAVVCEAVLD